MGQSFFLTRNYSQLRNASQTFSDLISATPLVYGLSAPLALEYKNLNDDYVAKFLLADAPETRTKVTILDRNNAADLLRAKASQLAKLIEGTASVTDGQKAALGLSVRATPQPRPEPGQPNTFKAALVPGEPSLEISWKAVNPSGTQTIYQVYRKVAGGEWTHLGDAGVKKFFDSSLPAGTSEVVYKVRGIRSTVAGQWGTFEVSFGGASVGLAKGVSVAEPAPKLAA
jgi:hypothetical protein